MLINYSIKGSQSLLIFIFQKDSDGMVNAVKFIVTE